MDRPLGVRAPARRRLGGLQAPAPAAEDIDAVREALGLERITLYGDSYGTYLAQAYAFRHPDALDALVLDGAYPVPGESPWYPSLITTGNEAHRRRLPALAELLGRRRRACSSGPARYMRRNGMNVGALIDAIAGGSYGPPQSYVAVDRAIASCSTAGRERGGG